MPSPVIGSTAPIVVQQYVDELSHLRRIRRVLVRAPHVRLLHLSRLDERINAHLDGLMTAGTTARQLCVETLAQPGVGELFAATIYALEGSDVPLLDRLLAVAELVPPAKLGVSSAFGWISPSRLRTIIPALLRETSGFRREIGLAACELHRVDPGEPLRRGIDDPDPRIRARAARVAGRCGLTGLAGSVLRALEDGDAECRQQAAVAALLLGDRGGCLDVILSNDSTDSSRLPAFCLAVLALPLQRSDEILRSLAADPALNRVTVTAVGVTGDPRYAPWLLSQMRERVSARLATEAFQLMSGVDVVQTGLDGEPPPGQQDSPNDDPADGAVALDIEHYLPWPDVKKVEAWWHANQHRFQPGTRYFMGQPVTKEHCIQVLKTGYQRQRILAAHYLCLLEPGTPLFNTSAPAWRQQRLLAKM